MRLLELKNPNVIVVYGGGFQPFHQGHMSSYSQAKEAFPNADFYVAASNDTKTRPIPFEAKQFLAQQAGVIDPFVQVSQPINPREILAKYNPEKDVLILVRSERDPMSYTKKDGSPGYYQPFVSLDECQPFGIHGYILVTKKHIFNVNGEETYSGSQVRDMYANASPEERVNIIKQLYPKSKNQKKILQVFNQYLGGEVK
jgi:cytidyltransferase-like protein